MKILNEHIKKNEFKNLYLIYGEEEYLKKQYRDRLHTAIIGVDDMNYSYFEGKKIEPQRITEIADTLPFFAERRLIIIENSGLFKSASDEIVDLCKNIPEYLYIIFIEGEVDKRNRLYKTVHEKGYIAEMKYQDLPVLSNWIVGLLKSENKRIERQALELFLNKTGVQMDNIKTELEKLICYTIDRSDILEGDVEEVCTTQISSKIFDMITAISLRKQKNALALYYDLLMLKEPPMRILFLLTRQFNMMLQVKEMLNDRYDSGSISKKLATAPFIINKYITQSKGFSFQRLRSAIEEFAAVEEDVKTGKLDDKIGVELLIIKYSEK